MTERFSILLLVLVLCFSCKKKDDVFYPIVQITEPVENATFNIYDTIQVKATMSVEDGLRNGKLTLVDDNFISVGIDQSFNLSGNSFALTASIVISNPQLSSGTYHVALLVNGNSEDGIAYRQISITGIPKVRDGIAAVCRSGSGYETWKLDNSGTQTLMHSKPDAYCCMDVNSRFNLVYTSPIESGDLQALAADDFSELWSYPAQGAGGIPFFRNMHYSNELLFVCRQDRSIRGYDFQGAQKFLAQSAENTYPESCKLYGNYLFVEQVGLTGLQRKVVAFQLSSAIPWQNADIDADIIDFFKGSDPHFYTAGNLNGDIKVYEYNFNTNVFHVQRTVASDSLRAICEREEAHYLLATNTGIYAYDAVSDQLGLWLAVNDANSLGYDPVNDQVIIGRQNNVEVRPFSAPTTVLLNYSLTDMVYSAKAYFNRE